MNRGYDGNDIFFGNHNKCQFLDYVEGGWQSNDDSPLCCEFKNIHGVNFDEIDSGTWTGKRLRGKLLVLLKDKAGLKYKEISEISVFSKR